jgi:hypothetical protein
MAWENDQKEINDLVSSINTTIRYPASLNGNNHFTSIAGLDEWIGTVVGRMLDVGIDLTAEGANEEGVYETSQRLPDTFGELGGAILMNASGDGNDCLIHSFLTTTCSAFQTLSELGRIAVARHFRTVVLAKLRHFQNIPKFDDEPIYVRNKNGTRVQAKEQVYNPKTRKYEYTGKLAFRNVSDYLEKRSPLSEIFGIRLAQQFNIGILFVESQDELPYAQLRIQQIQEI